MDSLRSTVALDEEVAHLGLHLAELLDAQGGAEAAEAILTRLGAVGEDADLAQARARLALRRGDAAAALEALVPLWSRADTAELVIDTVVVVALALGMHEVVDAICIEEPHRDSVRWVHWLARAAEPAGVDALPPTDSAESRWILRQILTTLARCGRADLIGAADEALGCWPSLQALARDLPHRPIPTRRLQSADPAELRPAFEAAWGGPDAHVAFNWAWAATRDVGEGERVLLAGPGGRAIALLLPHAEVVQVDLEPGPGVDLVADPEALPVGSGRFDHVFSAHWIEAALNPEAALKALTRAACHEGQLHLLVAGPAATSEGVQMPSGHVRRLCHRLDLCLDGLASRDTMGLPAEGPEVAYSLVRASRWLF